MPKPRQSGCDKALLPPVSDLARADGRRDQTTAPVRDSFNESSRAGREARFADSPRSSLVKVSATTLTDPSTRSRRPRTSKGRGAAGDLPPTGPGPSRADDVHEPGLVLEVQKDGAPCTLGSSGGG